jgi:hypothetical protein
MKGEEEEEEEEEGASCYCPSDHLFSAGLDIQPKVLMQLGITHREREIELTTREINRRGGALYIAAFLVAPCRKQKMWLLLLDRLL